MLVVESRGERRLPITHRHNRTSAKPSRHGGATAALRRLTASLVCVALFALSDAGWCDGTGPGESVTASREQLLKTFSRQLEELAIWCETRGLAEQAHQTRQWRLPHFADKHLVLRLPASASPTASESEAADQATDVPEWHARFVKLRQRQAAALFALLPAAARQQQVATAFEFLYATVRENPAHKAARQLLGYQQHDGRWHATATVRRLKTGEVWHDRFGWLKADHVARYEKGERYYRGRWISAARETKMRDKIARGWRVETDHFEVTTNHSLEAGVALAGQLEQLHNAWYQLFAAYHTTPAELKKLLRSGKPSRRATARHKVVYFRSRDEYVRHLAKRQPGIERSLGIYLSDDRTAYFFAGDEQDPGTVLHEATHQLFQEGASARRQVAQLANVWIVEGIACYMESLRTGERTPWGGYDTVGGYDVARLPGARIRLLDDHFYIPFADLTRLGGPTLRRHPRAATIYTQSAGQAAFLMHYRNGRYRKPLVEYLRAIYSDRARPDTLSQLTGQEFTSLDQEYRKFLIAAEVATKANPASRDQPADH